MPCCSWCKYAVFFFLAACGGGGDGMSTSVQKERPVNDTGVTLCGDYGATAEASQNDIDCALAGAGTEVSGIDGQGDIVPAGQDALYGRDNAVDSVNLDGWAGFSFTKLNGNGDELPASAANWACVRDNVTGLVWEVKTDGGGLRDKDWKYTWFNADGSFNGGNAGQPDNAEGEGSDDCFNKARCDSEKYVEDINALGLCGKSDWRLPTSEELKSIVHFGRTYPAVDTGFFPETLPTANYWSGSPDADDKDMAWYTDFYDGGEYVQVKSQVGALRLVRVGKPYIVIRVIDQ